MYDISIYGHLVFDTVIDNEKFFYQTGGIVNVWKSLKLIDKNLKIHICPTNIGYSTIKINRIKSSRKSDSFLNQIDIDVQIKKSKISHICYINEIKKLNFIKKIKEIKTADLCTGKTISNYNFIDYLFVSGEDLKLLKNYKKFEKTLIVHNPEYSWTNKNKHFYLNKKNIINNANVLGAGDYFAACYIYGILNNINEDKILEYAHTKTSKYIRQRNET